MVCILRSLPFVLAFGVGAGCMGTAVQGEGAGSTGSSGGTSVTTGSTSVTAVGSGGAASMAASTGTGAAKVVPSSAVFAAGPYFGVQEVFAVDPATGNTIDLGHLGDLLGPPQSYELLVDRTATHIFAVGQAPLPDMPGSGEDKLVVLDVQTGTLTEVDAEWWAGSILAGITDEGGIVAVTDAAPAAVRVKLIDPTTGHESDLGGIGSLPGGSPFTVAYDHDAHVVYALGLDPSNDGTLYSFSLDTLTADAVPFVSQPTTQVNLVGVRSGGALVAAYWDGTSAVLEEIEPSTGDVTPTVPLGDVDDWGYNAVLDPITGVASTICGWTAAKPKLQICSADPTSEALTDVPVAAIGASFMLARY